MATHLPPAEYPFVDAPLVRFRLRHLLTAVAAVSVLLAVLMSLEGHGRLVMLVTMAVVAGHIGATLIGLRLRQHAERRRQWERAAGVIDLEESASRVLKDQVALDRIVPPAALGAQTTRLPWLPMLAVAGALLGGLAGAWLLAETIGHRATAAGIVLGAVSTSIFGAWLAVVIGGFVGISRHAWREAVDAPGDKAPSGSDRR